MAQTTDWGGILRRVRRNHGLSQRQLAVRSGVKQAVIARIESGATSRPDPGALATVLESVGCRIVVLSDEDDEVVPFDTEDTARDVAGKRFPAHLRVFRWTCNARQTTTVHFQFGRKPNDFFAVEDVDDRMMAMPQGPIRRVYRDGRYGPSGSLTRRRRPDR